MCWRKSINDLTEITGKRPRAWTAPAWSASKKTVKLLEELGIEYDHSFMHHDSQPSYVPDSSLSTHTKTDVSEPASHWMPPTSTLTPSSMVEIPANWHLDDWPPFQLSLSRASTHGIVDTAPSLRGFGKSSLSTFTARECPEEGSFVFPISIHP
ncbi:hypothetical protein PMIN03_012487 [Paraphaeosphaeria minitans]